MNRQLADLLAIPRLQPSLDSLYISLKIPSAILVENPPVQMGVRREAGQSGSMKLSRLVITIVVAVLICVFSVATSQAADPQNKGQDSARRSLKTIVVDNYQPYTFMNEKGSPDGFSVEIVKAVAMVMDLDLEIRAGTWEQATEELERGTIDLLPMMAYSVERDKKFDFSVPHTIAYDAIFHRSGDKPPGSLKDLSGKTVIVMNKDTAHDYLLSSGLSKTMRLQLVDSLPEALRQLDSGKGDAAIMPKLVGIITLRKLNLSNIDPSPSLIDRYTRPFSFAVKEGDQALLERLNQGLSIIKTTGQYDAVYKKWFGALEGPNIPWESALQLISLAGIILLAFAAWNVSLKHQVKSRTKDLEAEVAERKRKEEALRESEDRYRSLFGKASDGIIILSTDGKLIEVNEAFARMHGYSTGELLQMNIGDLDSTKTAQLIPERMRQLLAGEILSFEVEHNHKDGHVFPLEVSANLISIGGESCIQGFHRDITERKRAEEEIRQHEEYLRVALSTTNMAVFHQDLDLRYSWMYQPQHGYTTEQVIGKRDAELLSPDLAQQATDLKRRVLETGVGTRGEIEGTLNDKRIYYDLVIEPLRNTAGRIVGITGASLDITRRKLAEEGLREREEQHATILRTARDGFWVTDRKGQFLEVNEAICRNLGYSRDELLRMSVSDIEAVEKPEEILQVVQRIMERGSDQFEGLHRRKDGSLRNLEISVNYLPPPHDRFFAFLHDITERKRAEEERRKLERQLQTAQKMESVGTLAGGIAHDFNNVLTVIIGYGEMLKLRIANDPKAASDLDQILRSAEQASMLTRQLLTFARRQVVEPVNLDLNEVMTGLVKLLRKVTKEDIEIKAFPAECSVMIRADRGQVEQVLMNLCLNARDAMPEGGQLVIETGATLLEEEYLKQYPYMKAGRFAMLSVSDTGVGMDEKTRERIFEPFFTTKGPDKGTGLGLAVVYGIVKQHNGFIHVYSEPGKGTMFRVYFPEVDAPADAKVIASQGVAHGGSETILLAEDNESVRHLTEQTLASFGYKVLIACDGEEAFDIFRRQGKEIAMAVLDVVMPKKGGKQAYDEMEKISPGVKVLFLSGYPANAIHESFVLLPGLSFLQKPFTPNALARKVREVLDRK